MVAELWAPTAKVTECVAAWGKSTSARLALEAASPPWSTCPRRPRCPTGKCCCSRRLAAPGAARPRRLSPGASWIRTFGRTCSSSNAAPSYNRGSTAMPPPTPPLLLLLLPAPRRRGDLPVVVFSLGAAFRQECRPLYTSALWMRFWARWMILVRFFKFIANRFWLRCVVWYFIRFWWSNVNYFYSS